MSLIKTQRLSSSSRSPSSITGADHFKTSLLSNRTLSIGSTTPISITNSIVTPKTGSTLSSYSTFDESDYELQRQIMHSLVDEIQTTRPYTSFNEIFSDQDDTIGCLLRLFDSYAENINDIKQISREQMLNLLDHSNMFDNNKYSLSVFINDWNNLRKQMIKKKIYERKNKTFDFFGFLLMIDIIKTRVHKSKDEIIRKMISSQTYNDVIKLKEIHDKIRIGLLPSMDVLMNQYNNTQTKMSDRRNKNTKKKKKKSSKKSKSKTNKTSTIRQRDQNKIQKNTSLRLKHQSFASSPLSFDRLQSHASSKQLPKLKTLQILEPWVVQNELDVELINKLADLFKLASEQFENGLIRLNVLVQWFRASHVVSNKYSINMIEGVLSKVLAHYINIGLYRLGENTFEWNGFMDCIRMLANEMNLSLNEFVKKMLIADEFSFQKWRTEAHRSPSEIDTGKQTGRPWDSKKVLEAVNIMRDIVEESRKLHLTDDERKRLRSLYKEFATYAYRRQSSHLEARLTNSVLSSWMRECRIFDDKYTVNELDKDFISILGDFTLNGVYPPGTRDIDFDGFLVLLQTIAAHKHIRADDLVQMIFVGPRSPLQKAAEFNEHMDRTKIQTSQNI